MTETQTASWLRERAEGHEMMAEVGSIPECSDAERETAARLREAADKIERLEAALRPFAELALTKTVAHGYQAGVLLTLSNGEKMCAVDPRAILNAHAALE